MSLLYEPKIINPNNTPTICCVCGGTLEKMGIGVWFCTWGWNEEEHIYRAEQMVICEDCLPVIRWIEKLYNLSPGDAIEMYINS